MASSNGIMSMFSNVFGGGAGNAQPNPTAPAAPNAGTPAPNPGGPGNLPATAASTGATPNGAAPNGQIPPTDPNAPPDPATAFAQFDKLWENAPTDPNAPASGIFGNVDPKKFMEAAGKIDFGKVITPEQLQSISAGGEGAMAAFAAAMNSVAQGVYAQSAFATTKIVEQALSKSKESFLSELPTHIKKQTVTDSLRAENPIFSNPAVQPIISALEAQMTVKYPNATAPEITNMAKQYVEALGSSFAPKPKADPGSPKNKKGETDWSSFLD